jgi:hypothetical protein
MEKFWKHGDYISICNREDTDVLSNTEMSVSNVTAQEGNLFSTSSVKFLNYMATREYMLYLAICNERIFYTSSSLIILSQLSLKKKDL